MRILHLVNYAGSGGSEKYVRTLIKHQISAGHSCVLTYNITGALVDEAERLGARSIRLSMRHPFDLRAVRNLKRICREEGVDVIHAHYPRENNIAILAAIFGGGHKTVMTAHLVISCGAVWRIINRLFSRYNRAVLCVCAAQVLQLIKNGVKPDRLRVVPNGVPGTIPENRENLRAAIREEFGISKDAFVTATLTRFEPVKGVDMLIDTARILKERLPDARFLIAGDGSGFIKALERIKTEGLSGYVIPAGFRRDTDAILCAADAFINTSRSEALSFAITEAMSFAIPAVVTDVGGNPEIIPGGGEYGYLVKSGDAGAAADALYSLAVDPALRAKVGGRARERILAEFSEEAMFKNTMDVYK